MIYLITGAPGTGKTARAITILKGLPQYPDRVIVVGVKDYKGGGVYYETLPADFDFSAHPGMCFLIDECQDYWPSRAAGRPAPEALTFLAKHRHIGQDYILTCQFPTQLDIKLRQLVGLHLHLQRESLGVFEYEAGACTESVSDFPVGAKRPRARLDHETFDLYQSMEGEETQLQKNKPRLPLKLWLILGVVVFMVSVVIYFLYGADNLFMGSHGIVKSDTLGGAVLEASSSSEGRVAEAKKDIKPLREIRHPLELAPGNSDYPELAAQPRIPVSCVSSRSRCVCFDHVGQLIKGMSEKRCHGLVAGEDAMVASWPRDDTPRRRQDEAVSFGQLGAQGGSAGLYGRSGVPPSATVETPFLQNKTEPMPITEQLRPEAR
jgi:zona occludens toxin